MQRLARLSSPAVVAVAAGLVAAVLTVAPASAATRADSSPGGTLTAFVQAAGKGDAAAMWKLLSTPTKKRLGPDLARFKRTAAVELGEGVGAFARSGGYKVRLSSVLSPQWAIAVITGQRRVEGQAEAGAYGVALRGEAASWRLELGGPVKLRILGPDAGEIVRQPEPQFAVEIKANAEVKGGVLYADGKVVRAEAGGTSPRAVTIYGAATVVKTAGIHFAAAIAATAKDATAVAWTFGFVPTKLPTAKVDGAPGTTTAAAPKAK